MEYEPYGAGTAVGTYDGTDGLNDYIRFGMIFLYSRDELFARLLAVCLKDEHLVFIELGAFGVQIPAERGKSFFGALLLFDIYNFAFVVKA